MVRMRTIPIADHTWRRRSISRSLGSQPRGRGCNSPRLHQSEVVGLSPTRADRKKVMRKAGWSCLVVWVTSTPIEPGAVAQLGERYVRNVEVRGATPLCSI